MRKNLYMFRCDKRISQRQIAEKIGVHRETYASVERGDRNGTLTFWRKFQTAFDIPDAEMGGLMRSEQTGKEKA